MCQLRGVLFIMIVLLATTIQGRQIRFNRFGKEIVIEVKNETDSTTSSNLNDEQGFETTDATEVEATVRELKKAPYPAAGYRPSKAFNLPGEENDNDSLTTTTFSPDLMSTTTEAAYELATTTVFEVQNDDSSDQVKPPYPAAGYRPDRAFNLPTENQFERENVPTTTTIQPTTFEKAPYPAAGYRPNRAFLLPNEIQSAALTALAESTTPVENSTSNDENKEDSTEPTTEKSTNTNMPKDNSKNPVCGVSLNPLRPRPAPGAKDDPDAERVFVPGVVLQPSTATLGSLIQLQSAQPLLAQPYIVPANRVGSYAYSEQFRTW